MFVVSYDFRFMSSKSITANVIGKIKPFTEPAKINKDAGLPMKIKIHVETKINVIIVNFSLRSTTLNNVFKKDTDVYAAPTTDVKAAQKNTIPNNL